jgi:hypothetical protein
MDLLELGRSGEFRRHPYQPGWKSDPNGYSRDQLVPVIAALGVKGDHDRINRSLSAMRTCNLVMKCVQGTTDIVGPDLLNLYKRALTEEPEDVGDIH